jgi:predicted house-cleaning noncanonical NTP pyrophosphatase (MazG superfamily)
MGKLVRDKLPELIRARGEPAVTRVLDEQEYRAALFVKLFEEATELAEATDATRVEELADVREVLAAIATLHAIPWREVEETAERKRAERGGFDCRCYLE